MILSVIVWATIGMWLYDWFLVDRLPLVHLVFFVGFGLAWVFPAMAIIRWMARPDDGIDAGVWSRVRPADLVGAIAGESSVSGREIGAIEITHRFSLVEVPAGKVDEVITALRSTNIKGRKATVKRDRGSKNR